MITAASLKQQTCKDLAQMAKKRGVQGWHSMRKEQLVRAILRTAKDSKPAARKTAAKRSSTKPKDAVTARRIRKVIEQRERLKDLAEQFKNGTGDRILLLVRDSYWLHACWELTSQSVRRVQAAMAEQWHSARPVLRLIEVSTEATTSASERVVRTIEIHGGVRNWYIDVTDPPKGYRVEVGYLAASGKFHAMARSNPVVTPRPSTSDTLDENWADVAANCEKIYALSGGYSDEQSNAELQEIFEERLRRPMGSPMETRYGGGAELSIRKHRKFSFDVDAEMIVYGSADEDAHITLGGEPVALRPDGTFTVRMSLPDRRQVLPVVCCSSDGIEQQTIVLAVERNTKVMEPVVRESNE